jgi:hypothetical protein
VHLNRFEACEIEFESGLKKGEKRNKKKKRTNEKKTHPRLKFLVSAQYTTPRTAQRNHARPPRTLTGGARRIGLSHMGTIRQPCLLWGFTLSATRHVSFSARDDDAWAHGHCGSPPPPWSLAAQQTPPRSLLGACWPHAYETDLPDRHYGIKVVPTFPLSSFVHLCALCQEFCEEERSYRSDIRHCRR